jgi:hypothetical protein
VLKFSKNGKFLGVISENWKFYDEKLSQNL